MDLGRFYTLLTVIKVNERERDSAEATLKQLYDELVPSCPHSEAIQFNHNIRGWGPHRRCKICGIRDNAHKGATSGDEYDYGFAGHPDEKFWGECDVEVATDKKTWEFYHKEHDWVVKNGKAVKGYL